MAKKKPGAAPSARTTPAKVAAVRPTPAAPPAKPAAKPASKPVGKVVPAASAKGKPTSSAVSTKSASGPVARPNVRKGSDAEARWQKELQLNSAALSISKRVSREDQEGAIKGTLMRYQRALYLWDVKTNPDKYGDNAYDLLCQIHDDLDSMRIKYENVAQFITQDIVDQLIAHNKSSDSEYRRSGFTRLVRLAELKDPAKAKELLTECLENGTTGRAFDEAVKAKKLELRNDGTSRIGERAIQPHRIGKNFGKALVHVVTKTAALDDPNFLNSVKNVEDPAAVLEVYESVTADCLECIETLQSRMGTLSRSMEMLRRRAVAQTRKAAKEDADDEFVEGEDEEFSPELENEEDVLEGEVLASQLSDDDEYVEDDSYSDESEYDYGDDSDSEGEVFDDEVYDDDSDYDEEA